MTVPTKSQAYTLGTGTSGPNAANAPIISQRSPASTDNRYPIGQLWINTASDLEYILTSFSSSGGVVSANWTITASTSTVFTLTGNSGGAISPTSNNINIIGAGGTLVAGSGSTLIITAAPQSFTWNDDPASGALVVNNGYIVKTGAKSYSLPAAAAVGDEIAIMLNGGTSWTITQAAGQSVIVGVNTSAVGVGGTVISTAVGDTIWLICTTANTGWQALSYSGGVSVT